MKQSGTSTIMEYKEERDWKNVREYLEKKKVEYSIMEERIDVYVQRRFIAHLRNLQKKINGYA